MAIIRIDLIEDLRKKGIEFTAEQIKVMVEAVNSINAGIERAKKLKAEIQRLKATLKVRSERAKAKLKWLKTIYKKVITKLWKLIHCLPKIAKKAKIFAMKNPEITERAIKIFIRAVKFVCLDQDEDKGLSYARNHTNTQSA